MIVRDVEKSVQQFVCPDISRVFAASGAETTLEYLFLFFSVQIVNWDYN